MSTTLQTVSLASKLYAALKTSDDFKFPKILKMKFALKILQM